MFQHTIADLQAEATAPATPRPPSRDSEPDGIYMGATWHLAQRPRYQVEACGKRLIQAYGRFDCHPGQHTITFSIETRSSQPGSASAF